MPIVVALVTTSFVPRFGIDASVLEASFVVSGLLDVAWLVYEWRRRGKPRTADSLIDDLVNGANRVEITVRPSGRELLAAPAEVRPGHVRRQRKWLAVIASAWRAFI